MGAGAGVNGGAMSLELHVWNYMHEGEGVPMFVLYGGMCA
ncbi:hypothetical protein X472_00790 [Bartonella bacilliformis San Pedro600-02]|nr:hypothetical protein X472_00790 [Bartonella bacilliformis San Pedro600-02]KEG17866.1 hypothetical protein H705_00160 [Bartonella bacilliformis Cond044]KEG24926.1 hypothetical protein H708_00162 [Bartonella bacilliformis VAB9028]